MVALPNTITNGTVVDAVPLQANMASLASSMDQISNSQIVSDAGISKSKIAERWSEKTIILITVPFTSGNSIAAPASFTCPTTMTTQAKYRVSVQSGQVSYLALVEHHVLDATPSDPDYPLIDVLVDGEQIGGDEHTIDTDDAYYTFANASPLSNPLIPLNDGAEIEVRVGATSGSPTIRGVTTRLVIKSENIS